MASGMERHEGAGGCAAGHPDSPCRDARHLDSPCRDARAVAAGGVCPRCDGSKECWVCSGSGRNNSGDKCSICSGTGKCYYCKGTGKSD